MNRVREYRPTFVDSDAALQVVEFKTLQQLLAVKFLDKFKLAQGFLYFAQEDEFLMAVFDNANYVAGYLDAPVEGLAPFDDRRIKSFTGDVGK